MQTVIKVNNATWTILEKVSCTNYIVERFGLTARLIFKSATTGTMLTRNVQNGRIRKQQFVAV